MSLSNHEKKRNILLLHGKGRMNVYHLIGNNFIIIIMLLIIVY